MATPRSRIPSPTATPKAPIVLIQIQSNPKRPSPTQSASKVTVQVSPAKYSRLREPVNYNKTPGPTSLHNSRLRAPTNYNKSPAPVKFSHRGISSFQRSPSPFMSSHREFRAFQRSSSPTPSTKEESFLDANGYRKATAPSLIAQQRAYAAANLYRKESGPSRSGLVYRNESPIKPKMVDYTAFGNGSLRRSLNKARDFKAERPTTAMLDIPEFLEMPEEPGISQLARKMLEEQTPEKRSKKEIVGVNSPVAKTEFKAHAVAKTEVEEHDGVLGESMTRSEVSMTEQRLGVPARNDLAYHALRGAQGKAECQATRDAVAKANGYQAEQDAPNRTREAVHGHQLGPGSRRSIPELLAELRAFDLKFKKIRLGWTLDGESTQEVKR